MSLMDLDTRPITADPDGDHDRFAHIVVPAAAVTQAYLTGASVTAICGKTWVPTRDPERYQICPSCKEIREHAIAIRDAQ